MNFFAIIFVAIPGMGKTTLARKLATKISRTNIIEFDKFYILGKSNNNNYLYAIEENIKKNNVILCKNHHNKESLGQVLDILKNNNIPYIIFNLIPQNFKELERIDQNAIVDKLLDRIEKRNDNSSALSIDTTIETSRKQAKNIIINAFVKKYEPPENCIYLDYNATIDENVNIIYNLIEKQFIY
jgi:hypothetical protein